MGALEILANLSWRFTLHFPCLTIFVFLSPPTRGQNFCRSGKTLHRFVSTVWPGVCNRGCGFEKSCPVTRGRSIRRFSRQSSSRLSRSLSLSFSVSFSDPRPSTLCLSLPRPPLSAVSRATPSIFPAGYPARGQILSTRRYKRQIRHRRRAGRERGWLKRVVRLACLSRVWERAILLVDSWNYLSTRRSAGIDDILPLFLANTVTANGNLHRICRCNVVSDSIVRPSGGRAIGLIIPPRGNWMLEKTGGKVWRMIDKGREITSRGETNFTTFGFVTCFHIVLSLHW